MKKLTTYGIILLISFLTVHSLSAQNNDKTILSGSLTTNFVESVYPNPANVGNAIYINLKLNEPTNVNVIVLDMIGNKLVDYQTELQSGEQEFHFHSDKLSQGVYFVNVISGNKKHVQRLIVR